MREDELYMQGSSDARPRPDAASGTAAQLFSGQFAQALDSFTSPTKQTYGAQVDQNVWLQQLSGQDKAAMYEGKQRDAEDDTDDAELAKKHNL